jgi:DNA-directed RNA polymerase sigma subunit (sigma70/sigma32)
MGISKEAYKNTVADLLKYPDWIVRIEMQALGGEPMTLGGCWEDNFAQRDWRNSIIEDFMEYDEIITRKIFAIERIFTMLNKDAKEIIRLRYMLPDNTIETICKDMNISDSVFHTIRRRAIEKFSRALGYSK